MLRPLVAIALLFVAGCGSAPREEPAGSLNAYRFAVVSFPNHHALGERAEADLHDFGLEILAPTDQRLQDAAVAGATLWIDLTLDHRPQGDWINVHAHDQAGQERYVGRGSGATTESAGVDQALSGLKPLLGPRGDGHLIEL